MFDITSADIVPMALSGLAGATLYLGYRLYPVFSRVRAIQSPKGHELVMVDGPITGEEVAITSLPVERVNDKRFAVVSVPVSEIDTFYLSLSLKAHDRSYYLPSSYSVVNVGEALVAGYMIVKTPTDRAADELGVDARLLSEHSQVDQFFL